MYSIGRSCGFDAGVGVFDGLAIRFITVEGKDLVKEMAIDGRNQLGLTVKKLVKVQFKSFFLSQELSAFVSSSKIMNTSNIAISLHFLLTSDRVQ